MTHNQMSEGARKKYATLSKCRTYRYWLERSWWDGKGIENFVNFVMLNPSTADAEQDDPTIRKCIGFAQRWGYTGMHVVNLFALRSTDPKALYAHPDPVGPENYAFLEAGLLSAPLTIVAWGKHGAYEGQDRFLLEMASKLSLPPRIEAIRINGDGSPSHPARLPYAAVPVPFSLQSGAHT